MSNVPRDLSLSVTAVALMQFMQTLRVERRAIAVCRMSLSKKTKKIPDSKVKNLTPFHPVEKQRGCGSTNFHIFLASVCIGDRPLFNPVDIRVKTTVLAPYLPHYEEY